MVPSYQEIGVIMAIGEGKGSNTKKGLQGWQKAEIIEPKAPTINSRTLNSSHSAVATLPSPSLDSIYDTLFERYTKKAASGDNPWKDTGYSSASDKADAYTNTKRTWMAHPAHRDAYQVSAWGGLKQEAPANGESCFIHLGMWDRAMPATDPKTGEKGVMLSSGANRVFYKDSEITSLDYSERPEAKDSASRADEWNSKQPHYETGLARA